MATSDCPRQRPVIEFIQEQSISTHRLSADGLTSQACQTQVGARQRRA